MGKISDEYAAKVHDLSHEAVVANELLNAIRAVEAKLEVAQTLPDAKAAVEVPE